jgi:glutaredoxin
MIRDGTEVVLFSQQKCRHCAAAKRYFARHGVEYVEYDISRDERAIRMLLALTGRLAVPTITLAGDVMVGFDAERLDQLLEFGRGEMPDNPYDVV